MKLLVLAACVALIACTQSNSVMPSRPPTQSVGDWDMYYVFQYYRQQKHQMNRVSYIYKQFERNGDGVTITTKTETQKFKEGYTDIPIETVVSVKEVNCVTQMFRLKYYYNEKYENTDFTTDMNQYNSSWQYLRKRDSWQNDLTYFEIQAACKSGSIAVGSYQLKDTQ